MPPKRKRRHHLVLVVVHPVPQDLPKKDKVKAQHPDRLVVLLLTTTLELAAMATSATAARYPHRLRQVVYASRTANTTPYPTTPPHRWGYESERRSRFWRGVGAVVVEVEAVSCDVGCENAQGCL